MWWEGFLVWVLPLIAYPSLNKVHSNYYSVSSSPFLQLDICLYPEFCLIPIFSCNGQIHPKVSIYRNTDVGMCDSQWNSKICIFRQQYSLACLLSYYRMTCRVILFPLNCVLATTQIVPSITSCHIEVLYIICYVTSDVISSLFFSFRIIEEGRHLKVCH